MSDRMMERDLNYWCRKLQECVHKGIAWGKLDEHLAYRFVVPSKDPEMHILCEFRTRVVHKKKTWADLPSSPIHQFADIPLPESMKDDEVPNGQI
jgi:hypothetical protein